MPLHTYEERDVMDVAEKIVMDLLIGMQDILNSNQSYEIKQRLHIILAEYDIVPQKKEIMVVETDDAMKILMMFLMSKKVEGCTKKTLIYYKAELARMINELNKNINEITTNDIRMMISKRNVTKTTQDNILRIYRSFFGWCTAEEIILKNPTLKLKKIKTEKRIKKPFTEIEVELLRNGAKGLREKAIIDIMLSTGCRIGELSQMNISDIENDQMIVYGKGEKERYVYLNAKTQVSIREYLKSRVDDNDALFVHLNAPYRRLNISGFEVRLRELGREIGITNVHPHRFRRTAATTALNRGMPIEQVQQMLGHSQIGTTLIYAQAAQENIKASHKKYVV